MSSLDRAFAEIGPLLEALARRRGPEIEKYYHNASIWRLFFTHPLGGTAQVGLQMPLKIADGGYCFLSGIWHEDDYDADVRRSRYFGRNITLPNPSLVDIVEGAIDEVAAWPKGSWTQESGRMGWHRYSRSEFESMRRKFPKLR